MNALMGCREEIDDQWDGVRDLHGHGQLNEVGKELLGFLSNHQATLCYTWFMKKTIHKQTCQHPRSKYWHCMDYVVMRQWNKQNVYGRNNGDGSRMQYRPPTYVY